MYVHKCLGRYFMTEPSNLFDYFLNCIFNREISHTRANVKSHNDGRCVAAPQARNFAL